MVEQTMDTTSLNKTQDLLTKNSSVAIVVGTQAGMDEMAAALTLSLGLTQLGKKVTIAAPQSPTVGISSLVGIDKVKTELQNEGGDLVVSFPYTEGEIEKVSYTLENGLLNIIVKAGELGLSFTPDDVQFKRTGGGYPGMLFVVGTPRLSDLGNLFDPEALKNTSVVNIDNKQANQNFGDIVLVDQKLSSVSEIVASLLQALGVTLDQDMAQNLMYGISTATNNFQDQKTSFLAFEVAGSLLKAGATRQPIQQRQSSQQAADNFMQLSQMMKQATQGQPRFGQNQPMPRPQQNQPRQQARFTQPMQQRPQQQNAQRPPVQQQPRPQVQPNLMPAPQQAPTVPNMQTQGERPAQTNEETPPDWLAPKVYKSSNLGNEPIV